MKCNLNDLVTIKLKKRGVLIYYQVTLAKKREYIENLKQWNQWGELSQSKEEIDAYLSKRSQKYFQQMTSKITKDGTLTIPLEEMIHMFGSALTTKNPLEILTEPTLLIDVNSGNRKLFPPVEKKLIKTISLQDQMILHLTEFGVFFLRKNGYQEPIEENKNVTITLLDIMKYLKDNINECGSPNDVLLNKEVEIIETKKWQKENTQLLKRKEKAV